MRYVESLKKVRTKLASFFSVLLVSVAEGRRRLNWSLVCAS